MNLPANLKYTSEHEWLRIEGDVVYVGITDYAQGELGEIVFVEVETVGEKLSAGDIFGTVEAVKTVSDLYLPMAGEILEFNEALEGNPELVNEDPYGKGWMIKVAAEDINDVNALLSADDYKKLIGA
ncbi:glycine cleavage system protein GcvH [Paludibacteraceae bacterium OttesenSCG-928-F17]|nr:glycine cleavage system protein GcvH [Paludibacteraceae bacterium OttesenSCG-928-F17]